jgi:hypothetical protein
MIIFRSLENTFEPNIVNVLTAKSQAMKIKVILSSLILLTGVIGAFAQEVEQDDMYFNSKDRAKLRAAQSQKASEVAYASAKKSKNSEPAEENFNPTDSYSARNVNPEYTSRSHSQTAKADDEDYFVSNYQFNQRSNYNNWNNSFNNWYGNSWYAPNYWGAGINSWNSPYYGSYYDSWGSPWANPYYQSGWSSSFSYYWGNSWNYGWSMGFGNCWSCNPYYNSWNPYYGYASYWNSPYYSNWGRGYYPGRVIVVESGNRYEPAYGKRNSRSSQLNRDNGGSVRYSGRSADVSERERTNSSGRVSNNASSRQPDYYNNAWRTRQNNSSYSPNNSSAPSRTSTFDNNRNSGSNSRSSWESSHRSTGSSPTYSPSQSRSSGFDGGSRSSGSSSGSGGSGSRSSRSRGN